MDSADPSRRNRNNLNTFKYTFGLRNFFVFLKKYKNDKTTLPVYNFQLIFFVKYIYLYLFYRILKYFEDKTFT